MYYTVYKTTNKINGKFYIGTHKTKNLDDKYMGSGKLLRRAIEKHGIENFEREILFVFDNPEEMFAKEAEIVNEDFLSEENTYNLKVGGFGGFDYLNSLPQTVENRRNNYKKSLEGRKFPKRKRLTADAGLKGRLTCQTKHPNGTFFGRHHSEETKRRMSEANKKNFGENCSQFGTFWITDGQRSKKIKKHEAIPDNWKKGRVVKEPTI